MKKRILICGAGSIGIYMGALLHAKKHDVHLFGRRKLKNVEENYVIIKNKHFEIPEKFFEIPKKGRYDFIFITSKLYDFAEVARLIKKSKSKAKIIAAVQNGLVDISKQSKLLGKKIIPVVVFSGFNIKNNEIHVNPTPTGWKTEPSDSGKKIAKLLHDAGIPCTSDKKFDSLRAEKTVVNCSLNCLSAVENKTFKELFESRRALERIKKLFEECYDILKQEHELDNKEKIKKKMFEHWRKLKHYSSTCQDLKSGRETEARFFNGYIVEIAKKYGLPFRYNKEILEEMKRAERKK